MDREKISELDGRSWVSLFSKLDNGYYRQELPKKQRIHVRVLYICLFLVSVVFYLVAAAQGSGVNIAWYVVVPEILVLICMFRIMAAFITYLFMGQEMSAADHNRSSFALIRASICAAVLQVFTGVGAVVYTYKNAGLVSSGILTGCLFLVSAVPMAVMYFVEKSILYTRISGPDEC